MKFTIFCFLAAFCLGCNTANTLQLSGKIEAGVWEEYSIMIKKADSIYSLLPDSLGQFLLEIPMEQPQFLMIAGVAGKDDRKWQFSSPFYGQSGKKELKLTLTDEGKALFQVAEKDRDNRALLEYNRYYTQLSKALWLSPPADPKDAAEQINSLRSEAGEISQKFRVKREVELFLETWSYLEYLNMCSSLQHIYSRQKNHIPLHAAIDSLSDFARVLDHPHALLFYSTPRHIGEYLKMAGSPEEQLEQLRREFKTPEIIEIVSDNILQHFVLNYDYTDFDRGLERLEQMSQHFSGREKLLQSFKDKRFTIPGSPLPDVVLEDREGNRCSLVDFKGKYLYIDLWAHWCAPCCAEVPYLQKLEKEIKNKEVTFISISIDSNKETWIKKMDELQMHGHQYIVSSDDLADKLNIRGIPHFLLYSKEGTLLEYKTLRPSSGMLKEKLEALGKPL